MLLTPMLGDWILMLPSLLPPATPIPEFPSSAPMVGQLKMV